MTWQTENTIQIIEVIVIIGGWFAVFLLNQKQQKEDLKIDKKMKVYEEFWRLRNIVSDTISKFNVYIQAGPPFLLMKSTEILGNVTKNQEHILKGEQDAIKYWQNYINELIELKQNFVNEYLNLWRTYEMWLHIMPSLDTAGTILFSEFNVISDKSQKYISFLQNLNVYKWKEWDEKQKDIIKDKHNELWEELMVLMFYTHDMMSLIHNELVTSMFDYKLPTRKPKDFRYKVLTKNGLVVIKEK